MNRIPEKQPAATFQTANVAIPPRRLSHIFPMSNPSLQPDAWPRGHQAASWNTLTEKMMIGNAEVCCTYPPPHLTGTIRSRAVTLWLSAVVLNTRGGLHYSKQCRCMWTNNNTYVHVQMLGAWSGADRKSPERAYVNCFDSLQHVWAALFIPQRPSSKTTGLLSKLSEGSTKMLLQIPSMKKITRGTDWWFFFKSKP